MNTPLVLNAYPLDETTINDNKSEIKSHLPALPIYNGHNASVSQENQKSDRNNVNALKI